ncbi:hypothetical protein GWO43_28370 [candidate division KSB1 bacterium]|nr:hypothetical protein [candidate division KSB1 bacterium]NIR70811.1 hypothetical protein [candidate division KSB1 bacterium]NIS27823.1 hypothetical protein [candidate division KSB1 bacterium]NIT74705.1 hypothetical protein [candidate division KSB1 bacterium]NIU28488.1 hypothetical protein [candidate division KSB1 bacterium]
MRNKKPAKQHLINFLALFTSTGMLLCCALPAAIAAMAGGAAIGALISTFPWLIPLSRIKEWLFLGAGLLIIFSAILTLRPQGRTACSITGGKGCEVAGRFTKIVFWISAGVYAVGVFFAYAIVPVLKLLEG